MSSSRLQPEDVDTYVELCRKPPYIANFQITPIFFEEISMSSGRLQPEDVDTYVELG